MSLHGRRWALHAIETQTFTLDGGAMFGVVPKPLWAARITPDERNGIRMAMRALLILGEGRVILVDCGMGDGWDARWMDRYRVKPATTGLLDGLARHRLSPEDVTDVICTHLHFDHTGGLVHPAASGGGALAPTFPAARHHVQAVQLAHALAPTPKDRGSYRPERFTPVRDAGLFEAHEGEVEIAPGVRLLPVNGHSPGMQLVEVRDDGLALLFGADLIPTAAHLPVPWVMAYDNQPLLTLDEKARRVAPHVQAGGVVMFEHDDALAAGRFDWNDGKPVLIEEVDLC
jgi:glyoxylase-like metal-dependent hydrolase (beta-lactamase superfamily II)